MLRSLEVENYRGFEKYRVEGLARVNLLTGMNNSGKTCLLEAVQLLTSEGDPSVLLDIARRRGDTRAETEDAGGSHGGRMAVVSHHFHGHAVRLGSQFEISGDHGEISLTATVGELQASLASEEIPYLLADSAGAEMALRMRWSHPQDNEEREVENVVAVPISGEGDVAEEYLRKRLGTSAERSPSGTPTRYLSPDVPKIESLSPMWNSALLHGTEGHAVAALTMLEPAIRGLVFLSGGDQSKFGHYGGILVEAEDATRRQPLGSYGDGMRHLLALSLALLDCSGGVLLIDEFDTGLHYSVMGDMWRVVIETAQRRDVQVFATTHSFDCIRGLAWLCEAYPELGSEVALHKISPTIEMAVTADAESIVRVVKQKIEVR